MTLKAVSELFLKFVRMSLRESMAIKNTEAVDYDKVLIGCESSTTSKTLINKETKPKLASLQELSTALFKEEKTGVLSDCDIEKEIVDGRIFYFSPDMAPPKLGNCSMDVRLGKNIWRMAKGKNSPSLLNPWSPPRDLWKMDESTLSDGKHGIPAGNRYHLLGAGEMVLAHTIEFVGGVSDITTMMKARSSIGRYNITVCKCAGWGDIGFINRWTLEITNGNAFPVVLPVGEYISQIVFIYAGKTKSLYSLKGSYQSSQNQQELIESWTPSSMLPKLKSVTNIV